VIDTTETKEATLKKLEGGGFSYTSKGTGVTKPVTNLEKFIENRKPTTTVTPSSESSVPVQPVAGPVPVTRELVSSIKEPLAVTIGGREGVIQKNPEGKYGLKVKDVENGTWVNSVSNATLDDLMRLLGRRTTTLVQPPSPAEQPTTGPTSKGKQPYQRPTLEPKEPLAPTGEFDLGAEYSADDFREMFELEGRDPLVLREKEGKTEKEKDFLARNKEAIDEFARKTASRPALEYSAEIGMDDTPLPPVDAYGDVEGASVEADVPVLERIAKKASAPKSRNKAKELQKEFKEVIKELKKRLPKGLRFLGDMFNGLDELANVSEAGYNTLIDNASKVLDGYIDRVNKSVNDPSKEKYREANKAALVHLSDLNLAIVNAKQNEC
jgi:hypothetical protein